MLKYEIANASNYYDEYVVLYVFVLLIVSEGGQRTAQGSPFPIPNDLPSFLHVSHANPTTAAAAMHKSYRCHGAARARPHCCRGFGRPPPPLAYLSTSPLPLSPPPQ